MSAVEIINDDDVLVVNGDADDITIDVDDEATSIDVPEQGPQGPQGIRGPNGTTLWWGLSSPTIADGNDGDSWFDAVSRALYGPKQGGIWPAPVTLVGAQGPQGNQGIQGDPGIQGPTGNTGSYYKNYVPNPGMQISLQNGNTGASTNTYWPADNFVHQFSHAGVTTAARVASLTPGGSPYRLRVSVGTAVASPAGGNFDAIQCPIEGIAVADLRCGTATAKQVTVQFNVKAPAGTYYVAIQNGAQDRYYLASYTITAPQANVDTQKSVTFTLDTSGTWLNGEGVVGLRIFWTLMAGTTGTGGAWTAGANLAVSGHFNVLGSTSNVFELGDVSLTVGAVAPAFLLPDIEDDYDRSARFLEVRSVALQGIAGSTLAGRAWSQTQVWRSRKAKSPTITFAGMAYTRCSAINTAVSNVELASIQVSVTNADGDDFQASGVMTVDARVI